jgi:hypothetical protein
MCTRCNVAERMRNQFIRNTSNRCAPAAVAVLTSKIESMIQTFEKIFNTENLLLKNNSEHTLIENYIFYSMLIKDGKIITI